MPLQRSTPRIDLEQVPYTIRRSATDSYYRATIRRYLDRYLNQCFNRNTWTWDSPEHFWNVVASDTGFPNGYWSWVSAQYLIDRDELAATIFEDHQDLDNYCRTPEGEVDYSLLSTAGVNDVIRQHFQMNWYCDYCDEHHPGGETCPYEVYCDHCGNTYHGDADEHEDLCREDCECSECRNARYGHPEDDQEGLFPDEQDGQHVPPSAPEGRRRFGIEVEYNSGDRSYVVNEMLQRGIACAQRSYGHETVRYWKLVEDASVTGGEAVSPIMVGDDESIQQVVEVMRAVKAAGGRTGSNCGMHVHIDVTDFTGTQLVRLAKNIRRAQRPMEAFCASSRFNGDNEHCERLEDYEWNEILEWIGNVDPSARARTRENRNSASPVGRYYGHNFNCLLTYGTVEIRLLGHTLNTVKVRAWIRVLQALFVATQRGRTIRSGTDFIPWLQRHGDLDDWAAEKYLAVVEQRSRTDWLKAA